ncbi:MAG: alkaline phosphatase D family protein [Planctomycetaceae bacterium]
MSDRTPTRRELLVVLANLTGAALWSGRALGVVRRTLPIAKPLFTLGVASGDPAETGAVLWTRLAPEPLEGGGMPRENVAVDWVVAHDEQLTQIVQQGTAMATPQGAHSVHVEVAGLQPDHWYWYQFRALGQESPRGRTRTAPAAGALPARLRFGVASCQHFETGLYTAYEHMAAQHPDLVVHLGDYIYEGPGRVGQVRRHVGKELQSLDDYRNRHAQYKTDPALQAMHAAVPWIVTWDDHEVDNNYANSISEESEVDPATFLRRRAVAYQAYYEHMPLRRSALPRGPDMTLYRGVDWGQLTRFCVLDTRQYRTDQPCGDGKKPPCPESRAESATLLGPTQWNWLTSSLSRSPARWNVLAQQVMLARVDREPSDAIACSMDQWPGYEFERQRLLSFLQQSKLANPIVLTGDIHSNWANDLRVDDRDEKTAPVAAEFVGTSISSGGNGQPEPPRLAELLSENPFVRFHNTQRGYLLCEVTPTEWVTQYQTVTQVTEPGGTLQTSAAFVVQRDRPGLQRR